MHADPSNAPRRLIRPGMLAGVVCALGMGMLAGCGKIFTGASPAEQVDQAMLSTRTGALLKELFPRDYRDAVDKMVALASDKSLKSAEIQMEAARVTAAIRVKYSKFAGRAPDAALRRVLEAQANLLRYVQRERGIAACSRMANEGPAAFIPVARYLAQQFDIAGSAMMTAIAEGRRDPVNRPPAGEADFDAMMQGIRSKGLTDEDIARIQDAVSDDSDCAVVLATFETLASMSDDVGDRLRSYMVASIAMTP